MQATLFKKTVSSLIVWNQVDQRKNSVKIEITINKKKTTCKGYRNPIHGLLKHKSNVLLRQLAQCITGKG